MEEQKSKKSKYVQPNVELIKFDYTDVIRTSICYGEDDTPVWTNTKLNY